jgi:regulator of protease activity HflC (stomatin/prohibitin superfamily)
MEIKPKDTMKIIIAAGIFLAVIIIIIMLNPLVIVDAGERGVVLNWGAFQGQVMEPGLHFRVPFMQDIIKINVQTEKLELKESMAYSHDLQVVTVASALTYNIDPKEVGLLYAEVGSSYEEKIITPSLEASVKQIYAQYTAEELLSKRGQVQSEIEDAFKKTIEGKHIIVQHYALVNESFSEDFEHAIEQKQIAEQSALKAKNDLDRIKIESEQRVTQANAEAQAIKIQAEAIQQQGGAEYVQLQAIAKWDGKLPTQMLSGGTVPFINLGK